MAAPGTAVCVCTDNVAPPIGAPFGPTSRPLIGARFPNFTFWLDERLLISAVSTTLSAAGLPFGCPRSPLPDDETAGFELEPGVVTWPGRSAVVAGVPVVAGCDAITAAVGAEQLVALPP